MKIEAPGQMGTPTNTNYNNEPTSTSRAVFHRPFAVLRRRVVPTPAGVADRAVLEASGQVASELQVQWGMLRSRQPTDGG